MGCWGVSCDSASGIRVCLRHPGSWAAYGMHLRHPFETISHVFLRSTPPPPAPCEILFLALRVLGGHSYWMPIGACDPMPWPILRLQVEDFKEKMAKPAELAAPRSLEHIFGGGADGNAGGGADDSIAMAYPEFEGAMTSTLY